jgi:hypothetical protein
VSGPALFSETQRFLHNPWAIVGGLGALVGCGAVLFTTGVGPLGGVIALVVFVVVAGLLGLGALRTEVRPDGLYLRLVPITRQHRFSWSEIESAEACRYRPILDYGGWGVRFGRGGRAYNVYGDRGVQLVFADGRRLLVGSQRPDELAAAIAAARGD